MRVVRVGLPALAGCLVLLFGLQSVSSGLQSGSTGLPGIDPPAISSEIQVGILPIGIGIVLLLAAVAIARRTRLGYWLGLLVGALMAVAGLGLIVTEIPFLQKGGLGGAIGGGIVVLAIVWTILWLAYTWRFSKASSDFEPAWTPSDRRMELVITAIVLVSAVAFLGIEALQANATADAIENDAQARAAVEATTLEVLVLDFGVTPASATRAAVNHLTLDLVLRNPQAYAITESPTLCLTSRAISDDPGYKQGMLCWGIPDPEDSLRSTFSGLLFRIWATKG